MIPPNTMAELSFRKGKYEEGKSEQKRKTEIVSKHMGTKLNYMCAPL
jgi:hypothetical protein